jgi:ribose transport system ATP-binding protein
MSALLAAQGISKRFPGVMALDGVDFDIQPGEVHVLLGENGAGKSTLVKILSGAYRPDQGTVLIDGRPVELASPSAARRLGISTVYQELSLVPELSIAQNIFLGRELVTGAGGVLRSAAMQSEARRLLGLLDVDLDPRRRVRTLSLALRQVVEIVRSLAQRGRVLILDEPTSALSAREADELFARVRRLKSEGVGICYISHRMDELPRIADRLTVMRDGRVVGAGLSADTPVPDLVRLMVGRDVVREFPVRTAHASATEALRLDGFGVPGKVQDVSLVVRRGEVVGLFGLIGAGRTELLRGMYGLESRTTGRVSVGGVPVSIRSARQAIDRHLGLVPEDRHAQGLVLGMSVERNVALASLSSCTEKGLLSPWRIHQLAQRYIDRLGIRTRTSRVRVAALSGGNQQKVVIARALATGADVVLLDEPTRGIDVGAKHEIYELINALAAEGKGVLLVSSELPEILGMSDRILVMRQGRVTSEFSRTEATQEGLLQAALPIDAAEAA